MATRTSPRPNARTTPPAQPRSGYGDAFPNSTKVYLEGPRGIRVPMREIALSGGEPPLRVYDSSGPQGYDPREGLPLVRAEWIRERDVEGRESASQHGSGSAPARPLGMKNPPSPLRGRSTVTQLHYARLGEITPEMEVVALREGMHAELVRSEVARGRAIIPANINHPEL